MGKTYLPSGQGATYKNFARFVGGTPFDGRLVVDTLSDISGQAYKDTFGGLDFENVDSYYEGMLVVTKDTGKLYVLKGNEFVEVSSNVLLPSWVTSTKPTYTINEIDPENTLVKKNDLESVATSGSYNDLKDAPTIPINISDLQNDSGFITGETDPTVPSWAKQLNKPEYTYGEIKGLDTAIENLQEKLPEYKSGKVLTAKDSNNLEWVYLNEGIVEFKGIEDNVVNIYILDNLESLKLYEIWYVLSYFIDNSGSDKGIFVIKDILNGTYYIPNNNIFYDSELPKYIDINYNILKDRIFIYENVFYYYTGSKLNFIHPEIYSALGISTNNPASQKLVTDNYFKTLPYFTASSIQNILESQILEGSSDIFGERVVYHNNKFLLESRDSNGYVYYKTWKYSLFYMNNNVPISRLYNYKNTDIYIYVNDELKPLSEIINNYTGSTYIEVDNGTISVKITDLETYFNNKYDAKYDAKGAAGTVQSNLEQLSSNVNTALSDRYTKTETYSKDEVDTLITKAINTHIINVINNIEF